MHSISFKPIRNFVRGIILVTTIILSQASSLWASDVPALTEAEIKIVRRVSNYENAGLTQTLLPDQRILTYFGAVLGCDMPILEVLYHVLKPQPITLDEYQVYQGLIKKDASLLKHLHKDLRTPMGVLVENDLSSNRLSFFGQKLKALPRMIGHYHHLRILYLWDNQLTKLPPEIGHLAELQTLDLERNQLTHLPSEIGQLAALKTLYLSGNQLTELPPAIAQLSALQTLYLRDNQLTQLPSEIGQLAALKTLYLSGNQLTHLPAEIGRLAELQELNLSGNPLLDGLDTSTAVQGYVEGADHIREMFPRTTNIIFTVEQLDSKVKIFGTRE